MVERAIRVQSTNPSARLAIRRREITTDNDLTIGLNGQVVRLMAGLPNKPRIPRVIILHALVSAECQNANGRS